jgi:hypothetical protein
MYEITLTLVAIEKQLSMTCSVSITLVIQNAKCMCHVLLSFVACPAVPCFPTVTD